MAGRNNTPFPAGSIIQRGPDMGNVPMADSYLRIKQNFDAIYRSLNNILIAAVPNTLSKPQLDLIQKELQAAGSNPLNLTGLIPINNLRAIQFTGTHSKRKQNFQPSTYPVGTLFFETDRTVLYTVLKPGASNQWYYETGIMSAVFANRPSDLGTPDAGFLFYATDVSVTYRWTGAAWVIKGEVGVIFADTHAAKAGFSPADYPVNSEYFETDRTSLYRNSGTAWLFTVGLMRAAIASRPADLGTSDAGFQFYATDTFTASYWTGSAWVDVPAVNTLNGLTGAVTIAAGTNISLAQNNNTKVITINAANSTGIQALTAGSGITISGNNNNTVVATNLVAGANITLTPGAGNNITISASGGGNNAGITSVNALTGPALTIAANSNGDTQVSAAGNNITINAADNWNNFSPAIAASNDNNIGTAVGRWVRRGKTVHFQVYWSGLLDAASEDIKIGVPANISGNIDYQTGSVWVNASANNGAIIPCAILLVAGVPDLIYVRSTAPFAANTTYLLVASGTYEAT